MECWLWQGESGFKPFGGNYEVFSDYAEFSQNPVKPDMLIHEVNEKKLLYNSHKSYNTDKGLRLYTTNNFSINPEEHPLESILPELIREKYILRINEKSKTVRHRIFGTTEGTPEGSKILPWTALNNENTGEYKYGLLSVVDFLNI